MNRSQLIHIGGMLYAVLTLFDEYRGTDTEAIITAHYQQQATWDSFDIGTYIQRGPAMVGIWYRGLGGFKPDESGRPSSSAIALMVGVEVDKYRFGYSYDMDISRLSGTSGGAHEISLVVELPRKQKYGKARQLPTPRY